MSVSELLELPSDKKLELISQLCESLSEKDIKLSVLQKQELDNRLDLDSKGALECKSWDEFRHQL